MSRCNYCTLKEIERRAKESGRLVSLKRSGFMGSGTDVYVYPPEEKPPKGKRINRRWHVAWFMALPKHCCC